MESSTGVRGAGGFVIKDKMWDEVEGPKQQESIWTSCKQIALLTASAATFYWIWETSAEC